jgi:hypothetical protein
MAGTPTRRSAQGIRTAGELAVNIGLPYLVYTVLSPRYGDFVALAVSAVPPMAWSLYELARFRTLDALSVLVLGGIVLSLAAIGLGGSPRMLMVRENLFSVPIGAAFLISAAARRPLIYYIAGAIFARDSAERRAQFESAWQWPHVVRALRVMSVVWGVGLIGQGALLGWMAWTWPIGRYLLVSPVIGYGAIALLAAWTYWYQQRLRAHRPAA